MLGKSLQTRDCPETLFRVCTCVREVRPGHSDSCGPGMTCFPVGLPSAASRRGPPRSGGKGSPEGAYLSASPGLEHRRH